MNTGKLGRPSIKRWLTAVALILPVTAGAYTTGTVFPTIVVDNTAGDQSEPHVSGNFAVYNIITTGNVDQVGYYDFTAQTRATVPSDPNTQNDALADVSGTTIVFTRLQGTASAIWEFSLVSHVSSEVAHVANAQRRNPKIGGNTIAWEDVGVSSSINPDIVIFDGATTRQITTDPNSDSNPAVSPSGTMVVWQRGTSTCSIYAASAPSWTETLVTANGTDPDTNGTQIVYANGSHIFVTTVGGGAGTQIPSTTTAQGHPAIAGNFVAYEGDGDIYVYDLSTGVTHQITNTPADPEHLSDITLVGSTVRVVWEVAFSGTGNDVYATEFAVASPPPPQSIPDLINTIKNFNLQPGIANSLEAKLNAAQASLAAGNTTAACNQLNALINEVNAQSAKKVTPDQASAIITAAEAIRTTLACP